MGAEADRVRPRFVRGCRAFALFDGEIMVAYGWFSTGREWIGELGLEIGPGRGEAYIWNCVTLPEHRRRGHYRSLLEGIIYEARAEGFTRLWIGSVEDPAEKTDAEVGFTAVMEVHVMTGLGLRWLWVKPVAGADPELVRLALARIPPPWPLTLARRRIH